MYLWTYCLQRFHIETAGSAKRDIYTKPTASREPKVTGAKRKGKRRCCGDSAGNHRHSSAKRDLYTHRIHSKEDE